MGALIEIDRVEVERLDSRVLGANVELPEAGAVLDAEAVDVLGWIVGDNVREIELAIGDRTLARTRTDIDRPDLRTAFEGCTGDEAGYRTTVDLVGAERHVELGIRARLRDGSRVSIATIQGHRSWRRQAAPAFAEMVSVVVTRGGGGRFLRETIESVLGQGYPHLEVVVIDDGEESALREQVAAYPATRWFPQESPGTAAGRNAGIRHTNGDFLVFVEAGDRLLDGAIEAAVGLLEKHPESAAAIGRWRPITLEGLPAPRLPEERSRSAAGHAALLAGALQTRTAAAVFRRAAFEHERGFELELGAVGGWELALRLARRFATTLHDREVVELRWRADSATMLEQGAKVFRREHAALAKHSEARGLIKVERRRWRGYWRERRRSDTADPSARARA